MDMIAETWRHRLVSNESISSIARDLKLSRPTVRKHCRTGSEPIYSRRKQPVPMLGAFQEMLETWLRTGVAGFRVGLVWAGNPKHLGDRQHSIPVKAFAPLWRVPGVRWFSVQAGERATDLAEIPIGDLPPGGIDDLAPELTDFAETSAALTNLDLVISVDTSVAHAACTLGRPVWTLLARVPDWRWLRTGALSPWYPTMTLFRRDDRRNWETVLSEVEQ